MEGIFPSPAEAETEEEMFTMPTIDMVATGRNIMRLREVAGLTVTIKSSRQRYPGNKTDSTNPLYT